MKNIIFGLLFFLVFILSFINNTDSEPKTILLKKTLSFDQLIEIDTVVHMDLAVKYDITLECSEVEFMKLENIDNEPFQNLVNLSWEVKKQNVLIAQGKFPEKLNKYSFGDKHGFTLGEFQGKTGDYQLILKAKNADEIFRTIDFKLEIGIRDSGTLAGLAMTKGLKPFLSNILKIFTLIISGILIISIYFKDSYIGRNLWHF